ncbi:hypothetical protein VNO78_04686 [Psophocarpus tetragonolobus]|uniref:RING-type E3 ubiquitin transferase n=1 Tax=Psophocarpus tetragonolobus TaxID=3891 RepID=A0AAN9T2Q0_PSOTE
MAQAGNQVHVFPRKFKETNPNTQQFDEKGYSYSLSGKIMLSAIVLLFFVVILMLCLHIYARWYLRRVRRRHIRRQRDRRRNQLVFYNDSVIPTALSRGLDAAVLATIPVFTFHPKTAENAPECAVCLSEFEPGEPGRVLPKCNHSFHTECIDMWFHSHATCPLCRAPVERVPEPEAVVVTVPDPEPGSVSVPVENRTASSSSSSSVGSRKSDVTIEVPPRGEISQSESGRDSPSTQSSFRSPVSRMLSFTRILSRERKGSVPPSPCGGACSSAAESDTERGRREETQ